MSSVTEAPAQRTQAEIISDLQNTVSASRLNLFLQCRLRFAFRYIEQISKPATAALHVGSAVHSALKAWNKARWKGGPLTLKQLHDSLAEAWNHPERPVEWEAGEEEAEKATAWRLVETYIRESPINADQKPEAVEVPVEVDLHHHGLPKLIGVIDLIQSSVIYDYKTTSQTPNAERAAHLNEVQACSYAVLYREVKGTKESGIEFHHLVKLKNPKLVVTRLGPMPEQQETRLFHLIEAYQHGLDARDFVPSPGMNCGSCQYFNECRAWS